MHVEDDRQRAAGVRRADDAHAHVADSSGDGDPAIVDGQLVDRSGLHAVEDGARIGRGELVEEGRLGGRFDELLRGGLEHDRVTGGG
jgi:hypothetical protein